MDRNLDSLFLRLSHSTFRSRFHLRLKDKEYVYKKGLDEIERQARLFVINRLSDNPVNDGKQTPMKGHPVFISQHATGCCCRGCLEKWHGIKKGYPLKEEEIDYIVDVLMEYIKREMKDFKYIDDTPSLFD